MILGNNALDDFSDRVLANKFEQALKAAANNESLSQGFEKSAVSRRVSVQDNNTRLRNSYRFE